MRAREGERRKANETAGRWGNRRTTEVNRQTDVKSGGAGNVFKPRDRLSRAVLDNKEVRSRDPSWRERERPKGNGIVDQGGVFVS